MADSEDRTTGGPGQDQLRALADAALDQRGHAYAPYSGFNTGAAVLTESGATHTGVLVENLIFGLAMCAERVALFSAVATGSGRPVALAVAAPSTAGEVTFPCGPCLQVAIELGGADMKIVATDPEDVETLHIRTIDDLAPGIPRRQNPGAGKL